jgi:hypothetical protein
MYARNKASLLSSRVSSDTSLPFKATLILALCSSYTTRLFIFIRVSSEIFLPLANLLISFLDLSLYLNP